MTIEQLAAKVDLSNQKVLVRVDLNVPLDAADPMRVTDDTRLRAVLPTVNYLLERQAAVILCSHFGRPKGEIIETGKNGRLTPVVAPLQQLLGDSVTLTKLNDCVGPEVEQFVTQELQGGQVCLLENTRFHLGETKNDPILSAGLGKLADYYVLDAFGTAHRAHSSTVGVTEHMQYSVAGFLMEKEIDFLQGAIFDHPVPPLVAIVGGAKVSTKIPVIRSLITSTDAQSILIGGGMIFTFYKALGYNIGKSLVEDDMIPVAKEILQLASDKGVQLVLPKDVVVADAFDNNANTAIAEMSGESSGIADDSWMGLDIGPETIQQFRQILEHEAATVVWNGPMGVFEMSNFAAGTNAIAEILAQITKEKGVISIVGGGDSVAAIQQAGLGDSISHISTGGGASLELLEGKVLPGIAALSDAE
jgi:phosphoglycerate kinase